MADDREPYGQIVHEQGRLTVNAELPERQRRGIGPWEEREPMQQEIDMRGAAAVAARVRAEIVAEIREYAMAWPPGFQRNLVHSAADAVAQGGKERSDEKEADRGQH